LPTLIKLHNSELLKQEFIHYRTTKLRQNYKITHQSRAEHTCLSAHLLQKSNCPL